MRSSLQLDDLFLDGELMERDFWPRFHLVRIPWKVQFEEIFLDALRMNRPPKQELDVEMLPGHVP